MKKKAIKLGCKSIQHIKSEKGFGIKEIAVALGSIVVVGIFIGVFRTEAGRIFNDVWTKVMDFFTNSIK